MALPSRQPADISHILLRFGFKEFGVLFGHSVTEVRGAEAVVSGQAQAITANTKNRPQRLRRALQELGPGFIKFGLFLSTYVGQMPGQFSQEFRKLQNQQPSFSLEEARNVIQEEFGKSADQLFSDFSSAPITSSILSQTYSASLLDGTAVAVKIQRPDIKKIIHADIALLRNIAKLVKQANKSPGVNPSKTVDAFEIAIMKELDFKHEAKTIDQFTALYTDTSLFVAPRNYGKFSGGLVVTTKLVRGIKATDENALDAAGIDRVRAAENWLLVMLSQMFECGLFHGDPHPGNVIILLGERIAYVNYALTGTLDKEQRVGLLKLLLSLVEQDTDLAIESLRDLNILADNKTADAIKPALEALFKHSLNQALGDINFEQLVSDVFNLLSSNNLRIPRNLALPVRAFTISESAGMGLNPEFNLIAAAQPLLRRLLSDELKPRALFKQIRHISGRRANVHNKTEPWKYRTKKMARVSNHQTSYALAIAALILTGSFLAPLEGPRLFSLNFLAVAVFVSAIILGGVLVLSIWRNRHAKRKQR